VTIKNVGYAKKKEIKETYPEKVCHMLKWYVKQKQKKRERCIPKEGMPHARKACQKKIRKEKDSPHPWEKKERDFAKQFVHPSPKIHTHLHVLIRLYDSFLLGSCF